MNQAVFIGLLSILFSHSFCQTNQSAVVWSCLNNDVNKIETCYLINSKGEKKVLNDMSIVDTSDPFFYEGLKFMVDNRTGKMGCIDETGKWAIEPNFDYDLYTKFTEGIACVSVDFNYGYIDTKGNWILKPSYSKAFNFSNGIALINKSNDRIDQNYEENGYFINKSGEEISKWSEFEFEYAFHGKIALATNKKGDKTKYGLYSFEKKKFLTEQKYEVNHYLFDHIDQLVTLFPVGENGKWGFIDGMGKLKIPCNYENALPFSDGMAAVKLNNKWGFIDSKGKQVIPCIYDFIQSFQNGKAIADFSFIDKNGSKLNYQFKDEYKLYFEEGNTTWNDELIGVANEKGSWDIINWKGELLWKGTCDGELTCFPAGSLVKLKDGSSKLIEEIKLGDELISYENGWIISSIVYETQMHETRKNKIYEITYEIPDPIIANSDNNLFEQKSVLKITGNHPILTKNGIKKAENILDTDIIYFLDSSTRKFIESKILSIKYSYTNSIVYNLKTTKPNYIVQDIVVMMK